MSLLAVFGVGGSGSHESSNVLVFTSSERTGVIIMAVAGVLSCAFVSILLLYMIVSAIVEWTRGAKESTTFMSTQIAVFLTCLLISDLIQSVAGTTQVKWAMENRIYDGLSCSIQAITLLMGDLGSTVWSCVIAANTFCSIVLRKHWPRWVMWTVVVVGWLFVVTLSIIVPASVATESKGPFFTLAGTWCFVSSSYPVPRLLIHYIPLFIASALIFVLYGLIFLVLQGKISFVRTRVQSGASCLNDSLSRQRLTLAKRMLWYPAAYVACVVPIAVTRLVSQDENVPEVVWIWAVTFLFCLGAVDSVIYATTRKVLKPIKLSIHMVTFGEGSGPRNGGDALETPRRSERFVVIEKGPSTETEIETETDMEIFRQSRTEYELEKGGVHVTMERFEEVI